MQIIKEVCVDSLIDAICAQKNGADRIELCSRLDLDGLTPEKELIKKTISKLQIPIRVMIRPNGNGFVYNQSHLKNMIDSIEFCKSLNVDGVVLGCVDSENILDFTQISKLASIAKPLKVIVHKAIDYSNSVIGSFEKIIQDPNINGVLSSGGKQFAKDGLKSLKKMLDLAPNNFEVISAGGITFQNFQIIHSILNGKYYHGKKIIKI